MQKLVNTVSKEDLLKIPFPKTDDIGLIIVDVETFIKDLKRDIALDESGEDDWHKYRITVLLLSGIPLIQKPYQIN